MTPAHCPGCGARERAVRYDDNPNAKPLGYRIAHRRPDCPTLLKRRRKAEEATNRTTTHNPQEARP